MINVSAIGKSFFLDVRNINISIFSLLIFEFPINKGIIYYFCYFCYFFARFAYMLHSIYRSLSFIDDGVLTIDK